MPDFLPSVLILWEEPISFLLYTFSPVIALDTSIDQAPVAGLHRHLKKTHLPEAR
jgi:hypothetical protein